VSWLAGRSEYHSNLHVGRNTIPTYTLVGVPFQPTRWSEYHSNLHVGRNTIPTYTLVGQYYFGARTGGASILEGLIELGLGLFLADSLVGLFNAFPSAILGGMMVLAAWQLARPVAKLRGEALFFAAFTGVLAAVTNMGVGALAGILLYHVWRRLTGGDE